MTESTLTQLKVLVERAVRPVRASGGRRRRMREELLAHVSGVFEEEAVRLGDDQAALARTAERFGDPAALTGQLQEAVPISDAIDRFADRLWFRPGESTLRRAVRYVLVVDLYVVLLMLVPVGFVLWADWPAGVLLYGGSALVTVSAFVFAFTFLADRLHLAVYGPVGPSWVKVVLISVAAALIFPGLAAVTLVSDTIGSLLTAPLDPRAILGLTVSVVVGLAAITHLTAGRLREHLEWASLDLG
jgi:hypothetical protein